MRKISICLSILLAFISIGCSSNITSMTVTLSFHYAQLVYDQSKDTGFYFVEDQEYPNLIEAYTYGYGHLISQEEYDEVFASASEFIPHNEGGYYMLVGFYQDMGTPSQSSMFQVGYSCSSDVTFYYSFEGGASLPPAETLFENH